MAKQAWKFSRWPNVAVAAACAVGALTFLVAFTGRSTLFMPVLGVVAAVLAIVLAVTFRSAAGRSRQTGLRLAEAEHVHLMLEGRLDALLRHAADVVVVLTPSGSCVYVSPSAKWVLGIPAQAAVGRPLDVLLGGSAGVVLAKLKEVAALPGLLASLSIEFVQPDGTAKMLEARLTNLVHDLAVGGVVLHLGDITDRHKNEQQLAQRAETDALTGLLNRSRLESVLSAHWADHLRRRRNFAVMFADLDGFKDVNDRCGHDAGDEVLREVAGRLRSTVRRDDVVVRYGGDEFVLICPNTDQAEAEAMARRINAAVCQPVLVAAGVAQVGISIGIAMGPGTYTDIEGLVRAADETMYRVKQARSPTTRR